MSLILYCVAPERAPETTVGGVGGAAVRSAIVSGLKFFFSEAAAETRSSRDLVVAAQQVHAIVSDIFSHDPVLPFRYPTVLAGENEILQLAASRGAGFREFLARAEGKVQMDVRLMIATDPDKGTATPAMPDGRVEKPTSGRAYLEARGRCQALLSAAAENCRQTATLADWRIQQQGENIRCQALIPRVEVISFLERMRTLELPDGVKAAVSGPWPPAGFWEDDSG